MALAVVDGKTEVMLPSRWCWRCGLLACLASVRCPSPSMTSSTICRARPSCTADNAGSDGYGLLVLPQAVAMLCIRLTMLPPA